MDVVAVALPPPAMISGALALKHPRGAGGAGQPSTCKTPRDPQDYAKRFIPRETRK